MPQIGRAIHDGRKVWLVSSESGWLPLPGAPWDGLLPSAGAKPIDNASLEWLSPVEPSKILGIGRNYADHAKEHGAEVPREPLIFLKASSAVLVAGGDVVLPPESAKVEFEGELALIIGRPIRRFREEGDLSSVILGYATANDVTARDLQRGDGQWARGKSFDTFCPISRTFTTEAPSAAARIETRVNGELRQQAQLSDLVFSLARIVAHASAAMTLLPGDVILTGTPSGVGPLAEGDHVEIRVEGVPTLEHGVTREKS